MNPTAFSRGRALALLAVLPFVLAACGGGGGGDPSSEPTPPAAQIQLAAAPSSVMVTRGHQAEVALTLDRGAGAASGVQLSIATDELPAGVTAEFTPATLPGSASASVLRLTADAAAPLSAPRPVHLRAQPDTGAASEVELLVGVAADGAASDPEHPFESPSGQPVVLPAGVSLGSIQGMHPDLQPGDDDSGQPCRGEIPVNDASRFVALCITLRNSGSAPVTVTLPPGTIFIADSLETQNGLLVHEVRLEAPVGTRQVMLRLFCANGTRHGSQPGDAYVLGPVADAPRVRDLIDVLAGRRATDASEQGVIQGMVWIVGDSAGRSDGEVHRTLQMMAAGVPPGL